MDDFELELKLDFLNESEDLLESAEVAFLRLEQEREDPELLNEIFRLAHNLKGTSKAVGFDQLSELTHVAENLILKLKDGTLSVSDSIVSTLLEFKDKVNEMVEGLKENVEATFDILELQDKLEKEGTGLEKGAEELVENEVLIQKTEEEDQGQELTSANEVHLVQEENIEVSQAAIESLRESGIDEETIREMLGQESLAKQAPVVEENKVEAVQGPRVEKKANPPKKKQNSSEPDESIRVKLSRIDKINNVIGELVILQTVVSQRRYEFVQDDLTNKSIGMMGKLFKEIQEIAMSLRMLPLKTTFQKMNRIVRDTSKVLNKDVELRLVGEETEVDKTVLEKISDPLVHIIRNAVDHGVESPEDREACGKNKKGVVELFAYHEGSNLVIQITDDGKGINPEVIRNKAIEKGVINPGDNSSDQEIIQLIFHPGLSTKEEVSEVSGRGVGMDVVKTNIESLGGEVKLMSKLGEGSSLKIILPLTLAIIEGLVIKAEDDKFVLPLSQIHEITQVKANDIESFSGVANLFKLRGEVLPLFYINDKVSKKSIKNSLVNTVIVVRGARYSYGVVVDDIINQQQIVIKKLGADIQNKKGVVGSAIMADGMPSLILDLLELFKDDLKASRGYQKYQERKLKAI